MDIKVVAFYLPQFHTIPENDEWWGKGFTEWVNVKKAKPIFKGHRQPRVPLNDNYYDLSQTETIRWQADARSGHGTDAALRSIADCGGLHRL
jgi:lipopolysaccharide biosynthesis protein